MGRFGLVDPTPELAAEVKRLCESWQDTQVFVQLHGLVQANLLSTVMQTASAVTADQTMRMPDGLRLDAADLRCAADGLAQFLEHLAERIEAGQN
jgi:alcohol dehydrogenase class IV